MGRPGILRFNQKNLITILGVVPPTTPFPRGSELPPGSLPPLFPYSQSQSEDYFAVGGFLPAFNSAISVAVFVASYHSTCPSLKSTLVP